VERKQQEFSIWSLIAAGDAAIAESRHCGVKKRTEIYIRRRAKAAAKLAEVAVALNRCVTSGLDGA
jgi:hypothetical protein